MAEAGSARANDPDAFDLADFAGMARLVVADDWREFLSVGDGQQTLLLEIAKGSLLAGPVTLRFAVPNGRRLRSQTAALQRFDYLCRHQRLPPLNRHSRRATERLAHCLRTIDAVRAGASQRVIAIALWGTASVRGNWGAASDCLRSRLQRLIRTGQRMLDGEYRALLS